mmetsp:Transcript_60825/g.167051  ORF Transcript_60825/g.167051 Transcript_60825/m.167051 type:complete len:231 (+) Transcript_60825:465-1157(+)
MRSSAPILSSCSSPPPLAFSSASLASASSLDLARVSPNTAAGTAFCWTLSTSPSSSRSNSSSRSISSGFSSAAPPPLVAASSSACLVAAMILDACRSSASMSVSAAPPSAALRFTPAAFTPTPAVPGSPAAGVIPNLASRSACLASASASDCTGASLLPISWNVSCAKAVCTERLIRSMSRNVSSLPCATSKSCHSFQYLGSRLGLVNCPPWLKMARARSTSPSFFSMVA